MKENDWTKSLCEIIKARSIGENIHIDVLQKILMLLRFLHLTKTGRWMKKVYAKHRLKPIW